MMHEMVTMNHPKIGPVQIDKDISDVVQMLWDNGIMTYCDSCQGGYPLDDAERKRIINSWTPLKKHRQEPAFVTVLEKDAGTALKLLASVEIKAEVNDNFFFGVIGYILYAMEFEEPNMRGTALKSNLLRKARANQEDRKTSARRLAVIYWTHDQKMKPVDAIK